MDKKNEYPKEYIIKVGDRESEAELMLLLGTLAEKGKNVRISDLYSDELRGCDVEDFIARMNGTF